MTNKWEREFFEGFGIEAYYIETLITTSGEIKIQTNSLKNKSLVNVNGPFYPTITDHILLELLCLLDFDTRCDNVETLKEIVLINLRSLLSYMRQVHHIPDKENDIYKNVRAVFGLESEEK